MNQLDDEFKLMMSNFRCDRSILRGKSQRVVYTHSKTVVVAIISDEYNNELYGRGW